MVVRMKYDMVTRISRRDSMWWYF